MGKRRQVRTRIVPPKFSRVAAQAGSGGQRSVRAKGSACLWEGEW